MRNILVIFAGIIVGGIVAVFGVAAIKERAPRLANPLTQPLETTGNFRPSPADRQIRAAQSMIEQITSDPRGYNLLSDAFMQKARESGDFSFNSRAEVALKHSEELAPDNYDALKLRAKLLLTYHRFREALAVAERAQAKNPKDDDVYGALTDALVEIGDYPAAVKAAQTMVDLRPNTASYSRVSYLRSLHGETDGAIEIMRLAASSASPQNPESKAWCLVQLGDELMNAGRYQEAEREFDRALFVFPDYHMALAGKARARIADGDTDQAIELLKRAQDRVPLIDTASALGDLYTKLGRQQEAQQQYKFVDLIERAGAAGTDTYSLQMALFWADHDMRLDEALRIAQRERATRADIYTCDTLAWCLYKKGNFEEARQEIQQALRLGTHDPRLYYHAGMIYKALDDRPNAVKNLRLALKLNPTFSVLQAEVAVRTLKALNA